MPYQELSGAHYMSIASAESSSEVRRQATVAPESTGPRGQDRGSGVG